jgi:hypothetical protein
MSLSIGERRRLRGIERSLADSDFWADAMPAGERTRTRVPRVPRRKKAGDPFWAVNRWLGYPAAAPRGSAPDRG